MADGEIKLPSKRARVLRREFVIIPLSIALVVTQLLGSPGCSSGTVVSLEPETSDISTPVSTPTVADRAHTLTPFSAPTVTDYAQESSDWPQLQHDPQRTGYTPDEVRPPYAYLWKWNEVPFASRTQPVVVGGRLFIGGLDGVMYARDAQTGAPLWTFATGGPIRHSAAVYGGRVFFGSHDGSVYALGAGTGALGWQFQTGGGIATAPAVANDTVYIGSTDGVFYALNTNTGSLRWSYDVGAPILTSAALSADGDTAYFGAEDITAYALDTANGTLRWSTKLQGQSLADRWPVVVGNAVIYRSQSLHFFHNLLHEGDDVMDVAGAVNPNWAADWAQVRPNIVGFLTENPDRQSLFVLNANTGDLRGSAPVLYTYGNGDPPGSPTVRGDEVYTLYRARHGIQQDAGSVHVTTRYDAALGRMSLDTLDITNLTLAPGEQWHLQYRATSDEPAVLSMAGSMLFVDNWTRLGGIDVDTGHLFEVANVADYWPECGANCIGKSGPMPFFDSYPFPGPRVGEGRVHRPAVIANGVIYWRVVEGGLAAIGHSSDAQSQPYIWGSVNLEANEPETAPDRLATIPSQSAQSLADYVWDEPIRPVAYTDPTLVARLEEEIQAIVNAGHMAPFFIERGFTSGYGIPGDSAHPEDGLVKFGPAGNVYWFDPGELIYTLSMAYPYLSSGLKSQVRSYLQAEMARYPPLEPLPYPGSSTWLVDGVRRERYSMTVEVNCWPPPAPPLSTLYALWTYADATGDWDYLESHWPQIKALFDSRKGNVDSYTAISGAIGYARIAAHLGHPEEAQEGENVAVAGMTAGQDFAAFLETANARYPDPRGRTTGLRAPVFFGLVPELGHYLRDTNEDSATAYLDALIDYYDGQYLWYLTRRGAQDGLEESSFHGPELAWSAFLAKAYIQGTDRAELLRYLDRPWGLGDLYYLQKLVAAIEANAEPDFSSSVKRVSKLTPASGDTITYTVVVHNSGDSLTQTLYLTDDIPAGLSYIPDSLSASTGEARYNSGAILWSGVLPPASTMTLTYATLVEEAEEPTTISNTAVVDAGEYGIFTCSTTIVVDGIPVYVPFVMRG
jgi:uncharacterized repeat protein (TIGR01451 family)